MAGVAAHPSPSVRLPKASLCEIAPLTASAAQKAHAVVDAGQVQHIPEAIVYDVGRYQVTLRADGHQCTCPATVTCKHIRAAALVDVAEAES